MQGYTPRDANSVPRQLLLCGCFCIVLVLKKILHMRCSRKVCFRRHACFALCREETYLHPRKLKKMNYLLRILMRVVGFAALFAAVGKWSAVV